MATLADQLLNAAWSFPDRVAVRQDDIEISYRTLLESAGSVAGDLRRRGLCPGDRVALLIGNVAVSPAVFYGVVLAGCVVAPLNPLLDRTQLERQLAESAARLVYAESGAALSAASRNVDLVVVDETSLALLPTAALEPVQRVAEDAAVLLPPTVLTHAELMDVLGPTLRVGAATTFCDGVPLPGVTWPGSSAWGPEIEELSCHLPPTEPSASAGRSRGAARLFC